MLRFSALLVPLLAASASAMSRPAAGRSNAFTPLKNDEHPCVAENLKESHRYICDDEANVICLSGWREPADPDLRDLRHPCPEPVCDYDNKTCAHGECVRPNVCACQVGWEGHLCDRCVPLPGCDRGSCEAAFECNCEEDAAGAALYEGAFCDRPACPEAICDPKHGMCYEPNKCTCHDGWTGADCKTCEPLPGCVNGGCANGDKPNTCECREGWTGHLCDQPICSEGCSEENGYCEEPNTCLCKAGWEGATCTECVAYWDCPSAGTCFEPNQCVCGAGVADNGYCNREIINGPRYEEFGECSNPCQHDEDIEAALGIGQGVREAKNRWDESGSLVAAKSQSCYGEREWVVRSSGDSDAASCVFVPAA